MEIRSNSSQKIDLGISIRYNKLGGIHAQEIFVLGRAFACQRLFERECCSPAHTINSNTFFIADAGSRAAHGCFIIIRSLSLKILRISSTNA